MNLASSEAAPDAHSYVFTRRLCYDGNRDQKQVLAELFLRAMLLRPHVVRAVAVHVEDAVDDVHFVDQMHRAGEVAPLRHLQQLDAHALARHLARQHGLDSGVFGGFHDGRVDGALIPTREPNDAKESQRVFDERF